MSQCTRFPTMWYVRPAKPRTSLRIRAVWSEPLLVAWLFYDCWATDWTPFGVSKLKRRLQRLVRVYTCEKVILLEISLHSSYYFFCCKKQTYIYTTSEQQLHWPINATIKGMVQAPGPRSHGMWKGKYDHTQVGQSVLTFVLILIYFVD